MTLIIKMINQYQWCHLNILNYRLNCYKMLFKILNLQYLLLFRIILRTLTIFYLKFLLINILLIKRRVILLPVIKNNLLIDYHRKITTYNKKIHFKNHQKWSLQVKIVKKLYLIRILFTKMNKIFYRKNKNK